MMGIVAFGKIEDQSENVALDFRGVQTHRWVVRSSGLLRGGSWREPVGSLSGMGGLAPLQEVLLRME